MKKKKVFLSAKCKLNVIVCRPLCFATTGAMVTDSFFQTHLAPDAR